MRTAFPSREPTALKNDLEVTYEYGASGTRDKAVQAIVPQLLYESV